MRNRRTTFVVYGLASPGGDIPADLAQALGKVLIASLATDRWSIFSRVHHRDLVRFPG